MRSWICLQVYELTLLCEYIEDSTASYDNILTSSIGVIKSKVGSWLVDITKRMRHENVTKKDKMRLVVQKMISNRMYAAPTHPEWIMKMAQASRLGLHLDIDISFHINAMKCENKLSYFYPRCKIVGHDIFPNMQVGQRPKENKRKKGKKKGGRTQLVNALTLCVLAL